MGMVTHVSGAIHKLIANSIISNGPYTSCGGNRSTQARWFRPEQVAKYIRVAQEIDIERIDVLAKGDLD
jgi:hypothetical protein